MKRLFLGLTAVLVANAASADLLISEYVEGSSSNKALELHNTGEVALDLSNYSLKLYSNGNASPNASMALSGSLAPGEVWVIVNPGANDKLMALADDPLSVVNHNGDDAYVLFNGDTVVDSFGRVGEDPGDAWTSGDVTTKDRTLRRRETVTTGDIVIDDAFDPADQWVVSDIDDFSGLGLPGEEVTEEEEPPMVELGSCGDPATLISQIQGQGDASPLAGEAHVVEAVVTGVFPNLSGFFVIEEDADRDGDDLTSEGLFVYTGNNEVSVQAGNQIRVSGAIDEYEGEQTQIVWNEGLLCDEEVTVTPATLTLPLTAPDQLAALEGMWVTSDQTLTVSEVYDLARYGSVMLSHGRRMIPTHIAEPGEAADAVAEANALSRILLDDGNNAQNPDPVIYPEGGLSATNTLRVGGTVTGLEGIVSYRFQEWRIQPVSVQIEAANPRPQPPARTAGSNLRVAAFNVLNFFNGDGNGGGFDDPNNRGADNPTEFERQKAKILTALSQLDADVIGLMEIENDGYGTDSAIAELTEALGTSWAFVDPGLDQLGTDAIAVGMLYRTDVVEPVGQPATLEGGPFTDKSRQPLAMSFRHLNSGEVVTVSVNHLKSKGSCPEDGSDANAEHGQGCWNPLRTESARMLADWLANNPTGLEDAAAGTLIIGDLNAYAKEDPIRTLEDAGYDNLLARFNGDDAYSYVYMGETGYLDHALADAGLESAILGAGEWHINADEPRALDYNTEYKSEGQIDSFYAADAYRASDHDPVWVDLALDGGEEPQPEPEPGDSGSSGGGAFGGMITLALLAGLRRRIRR